MVLVIVGIIIMIVLPALTVVRKSNQTAVTDSNLQSLLRATAAYVQANGCLPCPSPANAVGIGFGRVRGDTSASPSACGGTCAAADGIAPFASLGIPPSIAKDGWGQWITMRVDTNLTQAFGVAPPWSVCTTSDPAPCVVGQSRKGLCAEGLRTASTAVTVSSQAVAVVFVSHGANSYGALRNGYNTRLPFPAGGGNGNETLNAGNTGAFANPITIGAQGFDDVLIFMARNPLVSMFGNGSCSTGW